MIQYSSMTMKEAIDEVMLQLGKLTTSTNLDTQTVMRFLNNARREVMVRTLPFKERSYKKTVAVSNGSDIPDDFIRPVLAKLVSGDNTELSEARGIVARETWLFTNTQRPHSTNRATDLHPVFWIWGEETDDALAWAGEPMKFYCSPEDATGILEYYAMYSDATSETETLNVPYEYEDLCVKLALARCYAKIGEKNQLAIIMRSVRSEYSGMRRREAARRQNAARELESLVNEEPVRPITTVYSQGGQ